ERVLRRAFHRFVVLGERLVYEVQRVELPHPRWQHDRRIGFARRPAVVWDIAFPCVLLGVPADHPLSRVERLPLAVDGGAIVENAPVHRPRPCPFRIEPDFVRRIGHLASSGKVALFRIAAAVDPVPRQGAAVVAQLGEAGHLFASSEALAVFVRDVDEEASVEFAGDTNGIWMIAIIPRQVAYRLWKYAVLRIRALHRFGEAIDDVEVRAAVRDRLDRAMAPLHPASAIDDAALFFHAGAGG